MTTLQAEISLMKYFDICKNLIVPCVGNGSNLLRFENDLTVLSKSGYATGIEIKVSKVDLKNDLKKTHIKYFDLAHYRKSYFSPIKYFYYAVPENLKEVALAQIPKEFGLIIIQKYTDEEGDLFLSDCVRPPEFLFNTKWTDKMRYDLARLGTMRILTLKQNIEKLKFKNHGNNNSKS